jgi:transposase
MSAKVRFKSYNTGIISIFPVDLGEKIPKNAPVRLIDGTVDGLKLDKVIETYKDGGTTPYPGDDVTPAQVEACPTEVVG